MSTSQNLLECDFIKLHAMLIVVLTDWVINFLTPTSLPSRQFVQSKFDNSKRKGPQEIFRMIESSNFRESSKIGNVRSFSIRQWYGQI